MPPEGRRYYSKVYSSAKSCPVWSSPIQFKSVKSSLVQPKSGPDCESNLAKSSQVKSEPVLSNIQSMSVQSIMYSSANRSRLVQIRRVKSNHAKAGLFQSDPVQSSPVQSRSVPLIWSSSVQTGPKRARSSRTKPSHIQYTTQFSQVRSINQKF